MKELETLMTTKYSSEYNKALEKGKSLLLYNKDKVGVLECKTFKFKEV